MAMGWRISLPTIEDLNRWAQGIKSASVTLLAAGTATLTGVGTFHAITADSVTVEPIKVPAAFEELGFTSEIATARLLDEIATYEKQQSSAKDKVSIMSRSQHDDLQRLQVAAVGGLDIRHVEGLIQGALGIERQVITGEITLRKQGEAPAYQVRLRRLPGNQVLLDLTTQGEPQAVLKKAALAMIEVFDPHIAAAIHWRARDEESALRMIDVVLSNERTDDDKYSLNLRSQINVSKKRYDAAEADFERVIKLDPKFAPAYSTSAWIAHERKDYAKALSEADKTIELAPQKWWGYNARGRALRELKRPDEAAAAFRQAITLKPDAPAPFLQAGLFFIANGNAEEALTIIRRGLLLFPEHAGLRMGLGDVLRLQGDAEHAEKEYARALEAEPASLPALIGLAELRQASGLRERLDELRPRLAAAADKAEGRLRERLLALLAKDDGTPAVAVQSGKPAS